MRGTRRISACSTCGYISVPYTKADIWWGTCWRRGGGGGGQFGRQAAAVARGGGPHMPSGALLQCVQPLPRQPHSAAVQRSAPGRQQRGVFSTTTLQRIDRGVRSMQRLLWCEIVLQNAAIGQPMAVPAAAAAAGGLARGSDLHAAPWLDQGTHKGSTGAPGLRAASRALRLLACPPQPPRRGPAAHEPRQRISAVAHCSGSGACPHHPPAASSPLRPLQHSGRSHGSRSRSHRRTIIS